MHACRAQSADWTRFSCRRYDRVACAAAAAKKVFVFGLNGYTAVGLTNVLASEGWSVAGTCRNTTSQEQLSTKGYQAFLFDPCSRVQMSQAAVDQLTESSHILSSIPPLGLPLYDPVLQEQLRLLKAVGKAGGCEWMGYLSSTGVYGDWGGDWVDESSPCRPTATRGVVRKAAEDCWLQLHKEHGLPVHVFRLGGIYGPGRSALEAAAQVSGTASASKQRRARQRFTSRCHVLDICRTIVASMQLPFPGRIYNIVDNEPAPRHEVVKYAQLLLQGATPTEAEGLLHASPSAAPSDMHGSQDSATKALEEKRVKNNLIMDELQVKLMFPSYREGLAAVHAGCSAPFSPKEVLEVSSSPNASSES